MPSGETRHHQPRREEGGNTLVEDIPEVERADLSATDTLIDEMDELLDMTPVTDAPRTVPINLDQLLKEIDEVLEPNARDFVAKYQQRGGQ